MKTVLILCTGNSCRSQMAEALVNHDLAGKVRAVSAGTHPQYKVADGAIAALKDLGIPTEGLRPRNVTEAMQEQIDLVVTVCDKAREKCPTFLGRVPSAHIPFHDPHGEPLESFMRVRDEIRAKLVPEIARLLG